MRIAHVDTGRDWRGGQAQVLLLLEGLRSRGHEVVLVAPTSPLAERACGRGIEWIPFQAGGALNLGAGATLAELLAEWDPGILHAHTARAHTVARSAGKTLATPVVVSRRVLAPVSHHVFSRHKYTSGVACYLCISRAVIDVMRQAGVESERLVLVPSAVDVRALDGVRERVARGEQAARLRELLGAPPGAPVIGAVGAMTREKGVDVFAHAVAQVLGDLPECLAVWIGDGPGRSTLERALARDGLTGRARVMGVRPDAHELMAQLTVFVSTSRHEGLGTAVLEAQALGVPVVVTDSGGVRDAVTDGINGRLVGDSLGVAQAWLLALRDAASRQRWREAALVSVQAFDAPEMVRRTLAEYTRITTAVSAR